MKVPLSKRTIREYNLPKKWNNTKEGLATLQELHHVGRNCQTLILHAENTVYINLAIFTFLKLCIDRLLIFYSTEVLIYVSEELELTSNLLVLKKLCCRSNDKFIFDMHSQYSLSPKDEQRFKTDISTFLARIDFPFPHDELQISISELFINAVRHSTVINRFNSHNIYFGALITNNGIKISLANNGDFFSTEIVNKYKIDYSKEYFYIRKALEQGFSTKLDSPGGLGLFYIQEFAKKSSAKLEIVSGKGILCEKYYTMILGSEIFSDLEADTSADLRYPLPGTLAYIEIDFKEMDIRIFSQPQSNDDYLSDLMIAG